MSQKLYLGISGLIFLMVSVLHLLRLVYGWPIIVGSRPIPFLLSFIGCPVSLCYSLWAAYLLRAAMAADRHSSPSTTT